MHGSIGYTQTIADSDFENLIPEEHFLKKVTKLVNFSFANKLTKELYNPNKGRPSISP